MALDPLGEVYSGKDGSGSAYIIPSTRRTPVDTFYAEMQKKDIEKKALDATYAKMGDLGNYKAWDRDVPHLQKLRSDFTTYAAGLYKQGVDPRKNPEAWKKLQDMKDELQMTAMMSSEQKNLNDFWERETTKNPDKYTPDSHANREKWAAMSPAERANTDIGIQAQPNHNYLDYIDKQTAKANFAIKTSEPVMSEVKGSSPYFTTNEKVTFDQKGAETEADNILSQDDPHVRAILSDAHEALVSNGIENPTPEQLHQTAKGMVVSHLAQRVKEEDQSKVQFKPKPSAIINMGDPNAGNGRFAWGVEENPATQDVNAIVNDPTVGVNFSKEQLAEYLRNNNTKTATLKKWAVKDMAYSPNADKETWTWKDENGKEQKVKGQFSGVEQVIENGKIKYKAVIIQADTHKLNGDIIPGKEVPAPYDKLQAQIEAYTRGTKNAPGFDLDKLDPEWKGKQAVKPAISKIQPPYQEIKEKIKNGIMNLFSKK